LVLLRKKHGEDLSGGGQPSVERQKEVLFWCLWVDIVKN
jgi:hypothetical protein